MSSSDKIAFSCGLTLSENQNLKALSQYHKRSMVSQVKKMIEDDYEEMKRNLL
jgi:hypothetical protein